MWKSGIRHVGIWIVLRKKKMVHSKIYKIFERILPLYAGENAEIWFPNGKNSIRVRGINKQEYVFTYNDDATWKFETLKNFMQTMKGTKK